MIRHLTSIDNVDSEGFLVDPSRACHGTLRNRCVADLAGPVDPLTHLNRDFPDHELGECVVVERLECGAPVQIGPEDAPLRAWPRRDSSDALGRVDVDARRSAWLAVLRERRERCGYESAPSTLVRHCQEEPSHVRR